MTRASLFTDHKNQVYQSESSTDISEQFVSIVLTILQQILFLLLCIDGRQYMELRLCVTAELSCSPIRDIFPHISLHDLPCHGTMTKYSHPISWRNKQFFHCTSRNPGFELFSLMDIAETSLEPHVTPASDNGDEQRFPM